MFLMSPASFFKRECGDLECSAPSFLCVLKKKENEERRKKSPTSLWAMPSAARTEPALFPKIEFLPPLSNTGICQLLRLGACFTGNLEGRLF